MTRTTCCIVGGGPAGMVLGLLLARTGVEVTVLEKHADFLRDFRGDTVHPSTLQLLDDLGLAEEFARLPQRATRQAQLPMGRNGEFVRLADFTALRTKYNYIAMVPQWDLLNLLADTAADEPAFTLRMNTEATGFIKESGMFRGVRYRTRDGETGEIRADLTVACDGRGSPVREIPQLGLHEFPCPIDAWWLRLPREADDPEGLVATVGNGLFMAMMDRGDYWQCACLIEKGSDASHRARGVQPLRQRIIDIAPWLRDRPDALTSLDEVKLLDVRLDRLRRWHLPGLLCIGDAAHAMSPMGGIGINLAVQDAVAAARMLCAPLREHRLREADLRAVQRRRMPTTMLTQAMQNALHNNLLKPALAGDYDVREAKLPLPMRVLPKVPWLRGLPAYFIGYGARRETPPAAALR